MKVIISVDSVKFPLTGIGRYTYELVTRLQSQADMDLLLLANGSLLRELPVINKKVQAASKAKAGIKDWLYGKLRANYLAVYVFHAFRSLKIQKLLKAHNDAVFHGPNFYLPEFNGPCVASFHDLSIFTLPQYHPPERVRFMQRELMLTLKRASMLITGSEYTKNEIATLLGYPADRIRVIPLACSADFHPRDTVQTEQCLKRLGLEHGAYTLFTGTIEPRKNIDALLDAYSALPSAMRSQWPLVITGFRGWQSEALHERIEAAVSAGWVRYLGYVADEDLPLLFAGARLFVFPSHYEGFGLPVLEAMASGVPVVCSNSSSLPEVVGEAALMCNHDDTEGLRQMVVQALADEGWRAGAITKGLHQAAGFSWEKCAKETMAVYRELADRN